MNSCQLYFILTKKLLVILSMYNMKKYEIKHKNIIRRGNKMDLRKKVDFFSTFYRKYMDIFEDKLSKSSERMGTELIFPSVCNYIYEEFVEISRMVLVYELHSHRERGLLKGRTSEERFESYNELVGTEEFHQYIEKSYPVLGYLYQQRMEHTIKCVESIFRDFINDREELGTIFEREFNEIYDIKIGNGDTHQLGETIAMLTGDFGKIMYKSRDLYNDRALNEIIDFLNKSESIRYKLKKNRVLCKKKYGWEEYIDTKECKSEEEVSRFYYREGCYLAIFFILNSGDMHFENIITDGEHPRIIDTETLVTASKFKNITLEEPIHNFLMDNVLSTSFLPINNKNNVIDVDLCGLSGGSIESQKIKGYYIENYGTDQMKLVRKCISNQRGQNNIPKIKGEQVDILAWRTQLLKGFEDAMFSFCENKAQLLKYITKSSMRYSHQRQLFRNTYSYAKFLETSYYPTYLSSFEQRQALFEKMRNPENMQDQRIGHEISLLNKGYIPAYYSMFEERTLYSNGEVVQEDYFNQSGSDTVKYKIASLSPDTIRLQKHIINLSYMTLIKGIISKPMVGEPNGKCYKSIMDGAELIFDGISKNIVVNPDNGKKDIYIVRLGDKCQSLQGLDMSLYEGGGLIWSMYCYASETKNNLLLDQSLALLESAEEKQSGNNVFDSTSVYSGLGSAIYILFNIYMETGNSKYYTLFEKYLKKFSERIDTIDTIDYMHGISGYVVLLSKILEKKRTDCIFSVYEKICEILRERIKSYKTLTAGIAHGGTGVALALSFLVKHNCKRSYLYNIEKILDDEKKYVNKNNIFWCRGIAGIVLAEAQILVNLKCICNEPIYLRISKELEENIEQLLEFKFSDTDNLCLCHGMYGYYDVINSLICDYREVLTGNEYKALMQRMEEIRDNLIIVTEKKLWLTSDYMLDTFMLGASGPAYVMLRMYNSKYPSILSLDIV